MKKVNTIDRLYQIKQEIKQLQTEERELVDKVKEKMIAKGKNIVYGSLAEAILSQQEKLIVDNERCFKTIGQDAFVKAASITKTGLKKAKVNDISKFSTINVSHRLMVNAKNKE